MVVQRLDTVIKRAEELESMQKSPAALDSLYEVLLSRRARNLELSQIEPVFNKFLSLAVELKRGKAIKEGLHQFKKIAVNAGEEGVQALIQSVKQLLSESEEAVSKAQQQADEVQVDDLEEESPQDLLLATVSSEEAKDRTDREVVTPWLKLQWENYRSVLDVLRNHSQLEVAYADVASQAFQFCVKFGRKNELRRLAELLRTHLQYAATQSKHYHADVAAAKAEAIEHAGSKDVTAAQIAARLPPGSAQFPIDLSDVNTLQRFLDTRFEQLNVAVKLELWQEAFRSVEDIHTLLTASHRPIPMNSMASYYETLARVFYVSKNHLFHAATWFRYFSMLASLRAPVAELRRIASFCVLSLLCIPRTEQGGALSARSRRWMALINLQKCPTRQGLIDAAVARNVLEYCQPELCELFVLLQQKFNPLSLRKNLAKLAPAVGNTPEFNVYSRQLLEVIATSIYEDLATNYTEVKLDFVLDLATLPAPFDASKAELESLLVKGSTHGYNVRIDHQNRVVKFVDNLAHPMEGSSGSTVRSQLFDLAKLVLSTKQSTTEVNVRATLADQSRLFVERKNIEKKRAEDREVEEREAEEERKRQQFAAAQNARAAEEQRLKEEEERVERERAAKLLAENQKAEKISLANSINSIGHVKIDLNDIDSMSIDKLQQIQVEELNKESDNLESRMNAAFRRYDHLERTLRREEAKIWREDAAQQEIRDRENYTRRSEAIQAGAKSSYELAKAYISRMSKIRDDYTAFLADIQASHDAKVAEKRATNAKLLEEAKAERLAEVTRRAEEEAKRAAEQKEREAKVKAAQAEMAALQKAKDEEQAKRNGAAQAAHAAQPAQPSQPSQMPPKSSPFGNATPGKPAASPFGAATPGKPASSPFGAATPGKPASNPFGAATPGKPAGSSSPFGAAGAAGKAATPEEQAKLDAMKAKRDAMRKEAMAAMAKLNEAQQEQPKPATGGKYVPPSMRNAGAGNAGQAAPKSSPFGNAKPASNAAKPNPFGNAKPASGPKN